MELYEIKNRLNAISETQANNTSEPIACHDILPLMIEMVDAIDDDLLDVDETAISIPLANAIAEFLHTLAFVVPVEAGEENAISTRARATLMAFLSEIEGVSVEEIANRWNKKAEESEEKSSVKKEEKENGTK